MKYLLARIILVNRSSYRGRWAYCPLTRGHFKIIKDNPNSKYVQAYQGEGLSFDVPRATIVSVALLCFVDGVEYCTVFPKDLAEEREWYENNGKLCLVSSLGELFYIE